MSIASHGNPRPGRPSLQACVQISALETGRHSNVGIYKGQGEGLSEKEGGREGSAPRCLWGDHVGREDQVRGPIISARGITSAPIAFTSTPLPLQLGLRSRMNAAEGAAGRAAQTPQPPAPPGPAAPPSGPASRSSKTTTPSRPRARPARSRRAEAAGSVLPEGGASTPGGSRPPARSWPCPQRGPDTRGPRSQPAPGE